MLFVLVFIPVLSGDASWRLGNGSSPKWREHLSVCSTSGASKREELGLYFHKLEDVRRLLLLQSPILSTLTGLSTSVEKERLEAVFFLNLPLSPHF